MPPVAAALLVGLLVRASGFRIPWRPGRPPVHQLAGRAQLCSCKGPVAPGHGRCASGALPCLSRKHALTDVTALLSAIGTIGAFGVALYLLAVQIRDRRAEARGREADQARLVAAWFADIVPHPLVSCTGDT